MGSRESLSGSQAAREARGLGRLGTLSQALIGLLVRLEDLKKSTD